MDRADLVIGLDLGTSGVRAVALDGALGLHAQARVALPPPQVEAGVDAQVEGAVGAPVQAPGAPAAAAQRITQDPELWWQAAQQALAQLCAELGPRAARVRALAVDGTSGTVLLTDGRLQPLSAGWLYHDSSCRAEAARIAALAPPDSPARGASSPLARLLHLQQQHPQAAHLLHQADWVAARLRGAAALRDVQPQPAAVSDENNVLKLGYDLQQQRWPGWFEALGVRRALLPAVVAPGTPLGPLDAALARAWGLGGADGVTVCAGSTDGVAAFLATGAAAVGDAVSSLGSTLVLKLLCERPLQAAAFGIYSHRLRLDGQLRWLAGGASNSGGAALLAHFSATRMAELTPQLQPDQPTGLDYYPLPATGERFPVNDPAWPSRTTPRPADDLRFFQGLLEGVAAVEAQAYRRLAELGGPALRRVISVGGGARNPAWTAIRARALGVPLTPPLHDEAACGAARLALQGWQQRCAGA